MIDPKKLQQVNFAMRATRAGSEHSRHGTLVTPIYQTSTSVLDSAGQGGRHFTLEEDGYIYTRLGNPTYTATERRIAPLEGGETRVSAPSGIGVITPAIYPLAQAGDHIVAGKALYGCTYSFLERGPSRSGAKVTLVDTRNLNEVRAATYPNTKLVYIETPANPSIYLTDIEGVVKIVHSREGTVLMMDNTHYMSFTACSLDLGVNTVVHSATERLNSHGNMIAGFIVGCKEYIGQVRLFVVKDMTGSVLGPLETCLIARSTKTLEICMERHCANAQRVAEFLEKHPAVASIAYPGFKSFPQYKPVQKQVCLPGAMIAFELKDGLEAGRKLMNSLHLAILCVNLGDAETPIEHPINMTYSPHTPEKHAASDISEGMACLSIGLENVEDTITDPKSGLDVLPRYIIDTAKRNCCRN